MVVVAVVVVAVVVVVTAVAMPVGEPMLVVEAPSISETSCVVEVSELAMGLLGRLPLPFPLPVMGASLDKVVERKGESAVCTFCVVVALVVDTVKDLTSVFPETMGTNAEVPEVGIGIGIGIGTVTETVPEGTLVAVVPVPVSTLD